MIFCSPPLSLSLSLSLGLANFLNLAIHRDETKPDGATGGGIDRALTNERNSLRFDARKHCAKPSRCVQ